MSILFDSHEHPEQQATKTRARNQQDERYAVQKTVDKYEDILTSGYQCKLFRDDQAAEDVNLGKCLIPWMGNKELLIDRYDCRGHLYRLEEFDFENMGEFTPLSPDRRDVENVCDEERFMDLNTNKDISEESILQEEEDKRGSALYDPFTAYQNIEYSYEEKEGKKLSDYNAASSSTNSNLDDTYTQFCQYYGYDPTDEKLKSYFQSQNCYQYDYADRPPPPSEPPPNADTVSISEPISVPPAPTYSKFVPPEGIELPEGMELPETQKMQSIIEKTAMFISKQSAQMEIVLKTKQSGNPQFAFLNFDNYLNPYYKLILGKIKDGEYKQTDDKASEIAKEDSTKENESSVEGNNENQDEDSSDGDENELHPLLQAHRRPLNQKVPSPPPPSSPKAEPEVEKPIINPVAQTKMTGKVEDLAKVYMTWKYTPNPGEIQPDEIEEVEEKEDTDDINEPTESGVEELPPPPLPPPPSFVLTDINTDTPENCFMQEPEASTEPPQHQDFEQMEHLPPLIPRAPIFSTPTMLLPPPPSRPPLFSQLRFQPPQIGQSHFPPQIGHRSFRPPNGHFLNSHFQHIPHSVQYTHPPELYQVRSSVPPPPPPPLPSLLPPGVDAPTVSIINTLPASSTIIVTYEIAAALPAQTVNSHPNNVPLTRQQNSLIANMMSVTPFTSDQALLPPGVENVVNEKPDVPPPPPPPLIPNIDIFNNMGTSQDTSTESNNEEFQNVSLNDFGEVTNLKAKRKLVHQDIGEELQSTSFDKAIKHKTSDEDFVSKNDTSRELSPCKEECPQNSDYIEQLVFPENRKSSHESKKRKKRSRVVNSVDIHSEEHAFNIQYKDEQHTTSHQLDIPPDNPHISPFDQINLTLKNIQGQNSPFSTSQNTLQNTPPSPVTPLPTKIIPPGKDLQLVIDRLALYVAKNGEEFEVGIKEKKDPRFDFLNPWNMYHPYYSNKKNINLEEVRKEKIKEEQRKKNLKVKFGLKSKVKAVSTAKKKATPTAASVFNQNEDEEDESTVAASEGFQPNKDPELEVKRRLQKQIEEKEKLLKQLHEQALLQQKIAEVNRQASIKPMLQNLTPQQQAMLKKKVQAKQSQKDNVLNIKQDERKKRAANFVGMLKKKSETEESSDLAGHFLRKRHFKETSGSKDSNSEPPDKANYEKKKDAFFKAINDAFKGT